MRRSPGRGRCPTCTHGLRDPGERQGDKGKATQGTRLRREVNEVLQRLHFTKEETETRDRKYASRPTGEELVDAEAENARPMPCVAFPSLSLMLIFLVYCMVSMSVLR